MQLDKRNPFDWKLQVNVRSWLSLVCSPLVSLFPVGVRKTGWSFICRNRCTGSRETYRRRCRNRREVKVLTFGKIYGTATPVFTSSFFCVCFLSSDVGLRYSFTVAQSCYILLRWFQRNRRSATISARIRNDDSCCRIFRNYSRDLLLLSALFSWEFK